MVLLTATAYDSGMPRLSSKATLIIDIININDNSPVFKSAVYNFSIVENPPPGTPIGTIHATDLDEGKAIPNWIFLFLLPPLSLPLNFTDFIIKKK